MLTAGRSVASTEQYFVSDSSMARCTFFSSSAPAVDYGVCTGIPCAKLIDGGASPGAPPRARRAKESS